MIEDDFLMFVFLGGILHQKSRHTVDGRNPEQPPGMYKPF